MNITPGIKPIVQVEYEPQQDKIIRAPKQFTGEYVKMVPDFISKIIYEEWKRQQKTIENPLLQKDAFQYSSFESIKVEKELPEIVVIKPDKDLLSLFNIDEEVGFNFGNLVSLFG